jgi:hypothetical protein
MLRCGRAAKAWRGGGVRPWRRREENWRRRLGAEGPRRFGTCSRRKTTCATRSRRAVGGVRARHAATWRALHAPARAAARRVAGPAFPRGGLGAQEKARRRVHRSAPGPQRRRPGVRTPDRPALATWTAGGPGARAHQQHAERGAQASRPGFNSLYQFSKMPNSKNRQLSEKSPKSKVVEEL